MLCLTPFATRAQRGWPSAGVPVHEICGFLGMTEEMFNRVYGHHHPDYQSRAVHALGTRF